MRFHTVFPVRPRSGCKIKARGNEENATSSHTSNFCSPQNDVCGCVDWLVGEKDFFF